MAIKFRGLLAETPGLLEILMNRKNLFALILCCTIASPLSFADFRYQETSRITGGAMVGMMKFAGAFSKDAKRATEPTTSTVLVKGNRMAHINPNTSEIIDLDKGTITRIDHQKKQYSVVTFQEMKRQMEEARKKAEQQAKEKQSERQQDGTEASTAQMNFTVNVRNTGAAKNVAGLDTRQSILSMMLEGTSKQSGQKGALAFTNDMWMAPEITGYGEVRDFNQKMALKMGVIFGDTFRPAMAAMQSGSAEGMAEMVKEMSKLNGVPVLQVMRMGTTANGQPLPAASTHGNRRNRGSSKGFCTVQKFSFILDEVATEAGKTFAIVIDEAHSSQGGKPSAVMSEALSAQPGDDSGPDPEDIVNDALEKRMAARKMLTNPSYFAFTATPKNRTLEMFGEALADVEGKVKHRPFHTYTISVRSNGHGNYC